MKENMGNYREHQIVTSASGPNLSSGPLVASYSVWKIGPNESYTEVVEQGFLPDTFSSADSAHSAAMTKAKEILDSILDKSAS